MGMRGMMVEVVSGRSNPKGLKGHVFWEKDYGRVYFGNGRYGRPKYTRVGIKDDAGNVFWDYSRNVRAIH